MLTRRSFLGFLGAVPVLGPFLWRTGSAREISGCHVLSDGSVRGGRVVGDAETIRQFIASARRVEGVEFTCTKFDTEQYLIDFSQQRFDGVQVIGCTFEFDADGEPAKDYCVVNGRVGRGEFSCNTINLINLRHA